MMIAYIDLCSTSFKVGSFAGAAAKDTVSASIKTKDFKNFFIVFSFAQSTIKVAFVTEALCSTVLLGYCISSGTNR